MKIHAECIVQGSMDRPIEIRRQFPLAPDGLSRAEHRIFQEESDFSNSCEGRYSSDGGKTWSDWENIYPEYYKQIGDDEYVTHNCLVCETFNPVHGHYVGGLMERFYRGGRRAALSRFFGKAREQHEQHAVVTIRKSGETEFRRYPICYDPPSENNRAYFGTNVEVTGCGDILFPLGVNVTRCCARAGIDVKAVFPSSPDLMHGCIIARGKWNADKEEYELTYSEPMVLSDLMSSRGLDEPTVAELPSGRILVVFRGSNVRSESWHTRIEPGAPALKWYAYSDDGGKTFSNVLPWRMDNGEVVYSSATISLMFNIPGKGVYWLGNITGPGAYGNMPRYPLVIGRVDDKYGTLMKETLQIVDTRRDGETEDVQLSNFYTAFIDDALEVTLTKFGQYSAKEAFHGDTWRYRIEF